ncbi:hypothetical protein HALLA_03720 (plasmid) [Halostagnicola larsenii XH-48]|uniref:Uncharacterized protein n=1 Tax=Halostagnicola larsenii XH-48 TaxID=797299 RepID=W0JS32_9EURY|nr:hypothetical protein [Halostagnicola larsenii]AHG01511.1 hypothetical protein HALLA_03720 [Halostagnicola larsenii XH-48]
MTNDESIESEEYAVALEDLREAVESKPIRDTQLSGLYEEASTARVDLWNTVTAFIDIEDGEAIVTDESKLAEGTWAPEIVDDCDAMLTVDVQRGLSEDLFKSIADEKLAAMIEDAKQDSD